MGSRRAYLSALAILLAGLTAANAQLPDGIEFIRSVEGIDEYRLDNGLQLLLFPDPSQSTITVNITYLVGSAHESYGETGMAHILEHLLFKGSTRHPEIPDELTSHGSRPNGTTWYDRTNYFETFTATDENLEWAIDLEADRMVNSFLDPADLESEMSVVRNEFEIGENRPAGVLEERIYSSAFLWHNYGNTTIGSRSDIENVPMSTVQRFYESWYRPDNTVFVIAGSFDRDRALELVAEKFGPLEAPSTPIPLTYTVEPAQDGARSVTLRRVGDVQVVAAAYHIPSGSHADHAPLAILAEILADSPSGRLHKALVETQMATSVSGRADRFQDAGLFYLSAEIPKDKSLEEVRELLLNTAEVFTPVNEEDVDRARGRLLSHWQSRMRNTAWSAIGLSEWASLGDWRLLFLHRDRLGGVKAADVNRVAKSYLQATNRTLGAYIPTDEAERVAIPASPDLNELLADYVGGEALAQGEVFEATPENIEARVQRSELPVGLKLALLPKTTRGETVDIRLSLHFGDEESLRQKNAIGDLTAAMLMRGSKNRSRQAIQDEIDALQAQFRVYGGASSLTASAQVSRDHVPDVLRLMADVLREPAFPETEFDQLLQARLTDIEEDKTDPRSRAWNLLSRHLQPWSEGDVRYIHTPDEWAERVGAVTIQAMRSFHEDFYGASAGELAMVGDFDTAAAQDLIQELFGDWKSRQKYRRLEARRKDVPALRTQIEIPDKESATLQAQLPIYLRDDDSDYPALMLGNFMTGGGFLNSRLASRIRGQDGLSYGVGSWFWADRWDESAGFGAWAMYAPQNDEGVITAFDEELQRIRSSGFSAEEVEAAKSGWLQQRQVSRSSARELVGTLASRLNQERSLEWDAELERQVSALTPQEIQDAFKRRIDPRDISLVRAGSFAGADEGRSSDQNP